MNVGITDKSQVNKKLNLQVDFSTTFYILRMRMLDTDCEGFISTSVCLQIPEVGCMLRLRGDAAIQRQSGG